MGDPEASFHILLPPGRPKLPRRPVTVEQKCDTDAPLVSPQSGRSPARR
jgi:hypothetical protein